MPPLLFLAAIFQCRRVAFVQLAAALRATATKPYFYPAAGLVLLLALGIWRFGLGAAGLSTRRCLPDYFCACAGGVDVAFGL